MQRGLRRLIYHKRVRDRLLSDGGLVVLGGLVCSGFFFSVKCQPFPDERVGGEFHTFFLLCVETWVLMVLEQVVFYKE